MIGRKHDTRSAVTCLPASPQSHLYLSQLPHIHLASDEDEHDKLQVEMSTIRPQHHVPPVSSGAPDLFMWRGLRATNKNLATM